MTQEHGRLEPISGPLDYSKYPLGSLLQLIPYHVSAAQYGATVNVVSALSSLECCLTCSLFILQSCATAAMHPVYFVHSEGRLLGKWTPTRGW